MTGIWLRSTTDDKNWKVCHQFLLIDRDIQRDNMFLFSCSSAVVLTIHFDFSEQFLTIKAILWAIIASKQLELAICSLFRDSVHHFLCSVYFSSCSFRH